MIIINIYNNIIPGIFVQLLSLIFRNVCRAAVIDLSPSGVRIAHYYDLLLSRQRQRPRSSQYTIRNPK